MMKKSDLYIAVFENYRPMIGVKSLLAAKSFIGGYSLIAENTDFYDDFDEREFDQSLVNGEHSEQSISGFSYLNITSDSDEIAFECYSEKLKSYLKENSCRNIRSSKFAEMSRAELINLLKNRPSFCIPSKSICLLRSFFDGLGKAEIDFNIKIKLSPNWSLFSLFIAEKYEFPKFTRWERIYSFHSFGNCDRAFESFFFDLEKSGAI